MEAPLDRLSRMLATTLSRREAARVMLAATAGVAAVGCSGITSPTSCGTGECKGSDGRCYGPCGTGAYCTTTGVGNCSAPSAGGVYCCSNSGGGGGGGSSCNCNPGYTYNFLTGKCCANSSPYYYPGTHGGQAGCYTSCPYIGDCGSSWQKC